MEYSAPLDIRLVQNVIGVQVQVPKASNRPGKIKEVKRDKERCEIVSIESSLG